MRLILFILLGACWLQVKSQIIYTTHGIRGSYDVYEVDLKNCTYKRICQKQRYRQIGIRPVTNEWVILETIGFIGYYNMNFCNLISFGSVISPISKFFHDGFDSDRHGFIWGIGQDGIFKTNPPSNYFEFKGRLDTLLYPDMNYRTAYNGGPEYFHLRYDIGNKLNYIIAIDTANPKLWRRAYTFPVGFMTRVIIELHRGCGSNTFIIVNSESDVYELNIDYQTLDFICNIGSTDSLFYNPTYGSSPWMYDPKDCDVFLDLDINNSSGENTNGFLNTFSCSRQISFLSDVDPDVYSDYGTMDSISIEILNPLDGNEELLLFKDSFGIYSTSLQYGLKLYPGPSATNDSLERALKTIRYTNGICMPTTGMRFVRCIAFKNHLRDTAYSKIDLQGPFYYAGKDNQFEWCKLDGVKNLYNELGSCYTTGGQWLPVLTSKGLFDPAVDSPGLYTYIVGDSICGFDSAFINIHVWDTPNLSLPNQITLCNGDSFRIDLSALNISLKWSDGDTSLVRLFYQEGTYSVEAFYHFGCTISDSLSIITAAAVNSKQEVFICKDLNYSYKGRLYSTGEIIKDTLHGQIGCDTFLEIKILAFPIPTFSIQGDTIVCISTQSKLSAHTGYSKYQWSTGDTINEIIVGPGIYTLTVTDHNGCIGSASKEIQEVSEVKYSIDVIDPVCFGDYGSIELKVNSGGLPKLKFYLNLLESPDGNFKDLNPAVYTLKIIDGIGCGYTDSIEILPAEEFEVSLIDEIELELGKTGIIQYDLVKGKLKEIQYTPMYNIKLNASNQIEIIGDQDENYRITFINEEGCEIVKQLKVKIMWDNNIHIPNAFSPNGDQINDYWQPYIGNQYRLKDCSIFDRWGNKVYSTTIDIKWNGRDRDGQVLLPGVYIYLIHLEEVNSNSKHVMGDLSLIR